MAGKVDVLAVLMTSASLADRVGYDDFEAKCKEASAAVAELIWAAEVVWESEEGVGETDRPQFARLKAALANVR